MQRVVLAALLHLTLAPQVLHLLLAPQLQSFYAERLYVSDYLINHMILAPEVNILVSHLYSHFYWDT